MSATAKRRRSANRSSRRRPSPGPPPRTTSSLTSRNRPALLVARVLEFWKGAVNSTGSPRAALAVFSGRKGRPTAAPSPRIQRGDRLTAQPGHMLAHYRLLERIGEGGMGVVWKALDTRLGRHAALKVLPPELTADPDRRRRMLREARAAAAVTHPNIATIYEVGEFEGVTFISMELVHGRTLRSVISAGPMPIHEALRLGAEIADGLVRAHETGIVHRDLKPDNI